MAHSATICNRPGKASLNELGFIQAAHLIDWLERRDLTVDDVGKDFIRGVIVGVHLQQAVVAQEYEPLG